MLKFAKLTFFLTTLQGKKKLSKVNASWIISKKTVHSMEHSEGKAIEVKIWLFFQIKCKYQQSWQTHNLCHTIPKQKSWGMLNRHRSTAELKSWLFHEKYRNSGKPVITEWFFMENGWQACAHTAAGMNHRRDRTIIKHCRPINEIIMYLQQWVADFWWSKKIVQHERNKKHTWPARYQVAQWQLL